MQKMLGPCEAENGTKIDALLQAGASGHKGVRQDAIEVRSLKTAGFQPGKDNRGELLDRNTEDCGMILK